MNSNSPVFRSAAGLCGLLGALAAAPGPAAAAVSGLCPDGSAFVVSRPEDAPCAHPKFVNASDLPPLRPQYLPRPYLSYIDEELRDEHNPYNLVDKAQALRELRAGNSAALRSGSAQPAAAAGVARGMSAVAAAPRSAAAGAPAPRLQDAELRDLTRLVALRQQLAPASLVIQDARGFEQLTLRFAHSSSTEQRLLGELGQKSGRVVLFSALAAQPMDFYANFLVAQGGGTFRPEPGDPLQSGFLLGTAGALPQGELALGYLVLPERFDLAKPLRIWWNDRELEVTLIPADR